MSLFSSCVRVEMHLFVSSPVYTRPVWKSSVCLHFLVLATIQCSLYSCFISLIVLCKVRSPWTSVVRLQCWRSNCWNIPLCHDHQRQSNCHWRCQAWFELLFICYLLSHLILHVSFTARCYRVCSRLICYGHSVCWSATLMYCVKMLNVTHVSKFIQCLVIPSFLFNSLYQTLLQILTDQ